MRKPFAPNTTRSTNLLMSAPSPGTAPQTMTEPCANASRDQRKRRMPFPLAGVSAGGVRNDGQGQDWPKRSQSISAKYIALMEKVLKSLADERV